MSRRKTVVVFVVVLGRSRAHVVRNHNGCAKSVLDPVGIGRDHGWTVFDLALDAIEVLVLGPDEVALAKRASCKAWFVCWVPANAMGGRP